MKKGILSVLISLLCLSLALLCGCSSVSKYEMLPYFDEDYKTAVIDGGIVAESNTHTLIWDAENYRVYLSNKSTGEKKATLPGEFLNDRFDEYGDKMNNNPLMEAPFVLEYYDKETLNTKTINAYTMSLKNGNYSIEKVKNGVKITYYLKKIKISVPIIYTLVDDHLNVTIDTKEIHESENLVRKITLMPFYSSVKNRQNGYLFVPSGSGALIYAKDESDISTYYSASVYGDDLQKYPKDRLLKSNTEKIKLPVFGAADTNGSGSMGIITSGAEAANIYVNYGNANLGYSAVYVQFVLHDFQNATANVQSGKWETEVYGKAALNTPLSVDYYMLNGETNNYYSMANIYRNYLKKTYGLKKSKAENLLNIKFLGGIPLERTFLGIPYTEMFATTTVSQAEKITEELKGITSSLSVNMVGFGDKGLHVGEIAGGYTLNKTMGSKKELSKLSAYCSENKIHLFMDIDIASFSKAGGGVSPTLNRDCALAINYRATQQFDYSVGTKAVNKESFSYYLIKRSLLPKIGEKAISEATKLGINGISLDLVSNGVYSDCREQKYFGSCGFAQDVSGIIKNMRKNSKSVLVTSANDYAAAVSDLIFEAPTASNKDNIFDCDIPFYQIVFKGYVPMTSGSLNLSADKNNMILKSAESGVGLLYTLSNNFDPDMRGLTPNVFYGTGYDEVSSDISKQVDQYSDLFKSVEGAEITDYEIMENGLRKTVFSSGTTVYVNYSDKALASPNGEISAKSYAFFK